MYLHFFSNGPGHCETLEKINIFKIGLLFPVY
jgi:hypothetical protein